MLKVRNFVIFSLLVGAATIGRAVVLWEGEQALVRLRFWEVIFESHLNKLILLNMGCNILYVLAKCMQLVFLGQLRELEAHKVGDRVRSYALVKIVFIGAILQEHDDKEMIVWFVWLSLVGFLKQMGLLVRDRLEYLTLSINTRALEYLKLADLLALVQAGNIAMIYFGITVFGCWEQCQPGGLGVMFLLLFECALIVLDGLQTTVRYCLHVINQQRDGQWEQRALYTFYSELICDLLHHSLSLLHFLHVWLVHGLSFTLTDALLFLHTRAVLNNIRLKLTSLRTFLTMDRRFPDATAEQLAAADDACSICRESMSTAKVLPCGHMFHLVCLRAWLEHSNSCPNCRRPITDAPNPRDADDRDADDRDGGFDDAARGRDMQPWDIFSWLPSLSIRVARQRIPPPHVPPGEGVAVHPRGSVASAIPQSWVRQVLELLPHLSPAAIRRDLALTLDVHVTIHRGLDGLIDAGGDVSETIPEEDEERLVRESSMDSGTMSNPSQTEDQAGETEEWEEWEDRWVNYGSLLSGRGAPVEGGAGAAAAGSSSGLGGSQGGHGGEGAAGGEAKEETPGEQDEETRTEEEEEKEEAGPAEEATGEEQRGGELLHGAKDGGGQSEVTEGKDEEGKTDPGGAVAEASGAEGTQQEVEATTEGEEAGEKAAEELRQRRALLAEAALARFNRERDGAGEEGEV